jgi:hypothetical protein
MILDYTIRREYKETVFGKLATGAWILYDMQEDVEVLFPSWEEIEQYIKINRIKAYNLSIK